MKTFINQQNNSLKINPMKNIILHHITGDNIFSELFFYTGFLLQNRCPTRYEKKVEDGFDFPSDKSSVSFWIVRVGWVNLMLQSICDDCWAHAWLAFQPVQFDLLESTSSCTLAWLNHTREHKKFGLK